MRVVVLGAGAVGSLFGARLAAAGESVLLIGRAPHVEAIRARGLEVEGVDPGTFRPGAATALTRDDAAEIVLVTVKSFDLAGAVGALARAAPPTPTVLLGNGLGIERTAERELRTGGWADPRASLARAVHSVPATLLGPGRVRASGTGEVIVPTAEAAGPAAAVVERFAGLVAHAGLVVRRSPAFELELWRKAVVNAAINPVTAARGVPNGALANGPARAEAEALLAEAVEVARRSGVPLPLEVARADLERIVRATAENRSSMLQDIDRGRPTELDAISEEIVRRGRAVGVELPVTERAIDAVRRRRAGGGPPAQR